MDVVIVGAGGQGKVVLDILRAGGRHQPVGFVDAEPAMKGTEICGVQVLGQFNLLPRLRQQKVKAAIVAIGDNRVRLEYARMLVEQGFDLIQAVHPAAVISPAAILGKNVTISAGAILCTHATIGDSTIVNTNAVVDHECEVGEGSHVAPGALLAGRVRVGSGCFIGLGAKIIQCVRVGDRATVGAGAVVIRDVPEDSTVVGVPARVIKRTG